MSKPPRPKASAHSGDGCQRVDFPTCAPRHACAGKMSADAEQTDVIRPSTTPTLADRLQAALYCDHPTLWLFLLRTLANGHPISRTGIASALKMSLYDVQEALNTFTDIEYDDAGDIVACGLSLLPTPHCFKVNGHDLFTWCALDTLMYPVALHQTAQVESHCPLTGIAVRLTVTPTGVSLLTPAGVVVSIVTPATQAGCCNIRSAFCSQVHFISSPQAAATWLSKHPEATILSVEEAWQLGHAIAQRRLEGDRSYST